MARDIGDAFPGIVSTPGVCGGEPCIVRTRLHQSGASHAGIIVCTFDPDFIRARRIHDAIHGQQALAGQLLRINRPPS